MCGLWMPLHLSYMLAVPCKHLRMVGEPSLEGFDHAICSTFMDLTMPCAAADTCMLLVQVYTAEEKAALAMYNFEENKKKEEKIIGDMQRLVEETLGSSGSESE